ncbi:MAG TPA: Glu/Leu/Phe/Val dehydrogenase [Actinomycetota bacterium]|jgi:glutamate dehydrogenase/leucine dehydrogenase|nr:Glu/Leu/Phe/Val dehydrogenase [Actinomycetota bacterium]
MDAAWQALIDELGPAKVALLHDQDAGLEAILVVDNVAAGPAIGGVRMAGDVTVEEVARLARAMTLKNAAAGLPHGGGKAGIVADPEMDPADKQRLLRAFARAIRDLREYVPGPDMGTDETCMAWVYDEIGRAVGLPEALGGIPLDIVGATGFGLAVCAEAVEEAGWLRLRGARVAVQGFGAVGRHAARFLTERGAVLVGASDSRGAVANPQGLEVAALAGFARHGRSVGEFPGGKPMDRDELLGMPCDILVPAARPDALTADNAEQVEAQVVLQGANLPATVKAEMLLHERGVLSVPDFIANAGGVICGAVEYHGGTRAEAFARIEEKVRANTAQTLRLARDRGVLPREAAKELARARLDEARRYRRRA